MQNALSALYKNTDNKLDRLSATIPTGMLRTSLKVNNGLASWLLGEAKKLYLECGTFTFSRHSQNEQSHQHAIYSQHEGPVVSLPSLAFFSRAEHYILFFFYTSLLAAVIGAELYTNRWLAISPPKLQNRTSSLLFETIQSFSKTLGNLSSALQA